MKWLGVTSKREHWVGIRRIRESVDGYDWAPFRFIFRVWRWRGVVVWKKLLAARQMDQYWLVERAFH